ncbi:stage IV sporulation protein FB [Anoxybacillus tepidamans]|uniref:Stage IV sporulation protein FB n=1 Tax=Anoxybacteroides tepidamans TaxID=265948 RepID=A0A7W8IPX0_9BACL|nr:M50 family metallopeptidase [Anoxybacillus tepidamans]MBB5324561.1 stage IV sporulation protein FB [Anoxybacillus tepidamans]
MNKYVSLLAKIHIHPLLWLMSGLAVMTAHFQQLFLLFFIVFVHELGHAVTALFFSWRIKQILLLPFGGVVEVEEHGNRPFYEELLVTLAGPVQHVWLVGAAFVLWENNVLTFDIWQIFFNYNVAIALINLLPIWPLDGGKLLFLLLTRYVPFSEAHEKMIIYSFGLLIVVVGVLVFVAPAQLDLWIIALFLFVSLWKEWKQRQYVVMRFLLERYYGKKGDYKKWRPITVEEAESVLTVLQKFYRGQKHSIIVVKNKKERAILDENELLHAFFAEKQTNITIGNMIYI